jgi:hypothetical protein
MGAAGRGGAEKQSRGRELPPRSAMPGKRSQGTGLPAVVTVEGKARAPQ